jgi:hypothetical protein
LPWMNRLAALGHGSMLEIESAASLALSVAAGRSSQASLPAALQSFLYPSAHVDAHGIALGQHVGITAESFGLEVSEGELLSACASHYTIGRSDPVAGRVHIHFPRVGFVLKGLAI